MHTRRIERLLWSVALVTAGAGAWGVYAALELPLDLPEPPGAAAQPDRPAAETGRGASRWRLPSSVELALTTKLDLRRQLFDPPPPRPKPKPKPKPRAAPNAKLAGVIFDARDPVAMISDSRGKVRFLRVGEQVGPDSNPAFIRRIEKRSVTLEHDGHTIELRIEQKGGR